MRISDWSSDVCSSDLLEQISAKEDPQTVRERVKKTVRPPNPAPSLLRFGGTLAAIGLLFLVIGAALYERLFVIEPDFAAVTAPEIRIYAPTDGELAPHEFDPGDTVKRDQVLVEVNDPEAEARSEEQTSEPQSLRTNSYAGFWLKKK